MRKIPDETLYRERVIRISLGQNEEEAGGGDSSRMRVAGVARAELRRLRTKQCTENEGYGCRLGGGEKELFNWKGLKNMHSTSVWDPVQVLLGS